MKCKNCEHSIFNETWGEYKCGLSEHVIYREEEAKRCTNYKKRTEKKEVNT